jgi:FMN phosphatase YigB (HAD superfamily)
MHETTFSGPPLKAIVFDVDGTLYRQDQLRWAMFVRLLGKHVTHPARGWRIAKVLQAYRRAQEHIRGMSGMRDIADAQVRVACDRTNVDYDLVVEYVAQWMEEEPLAFLPACIQPGLVEFLHACTARGLRLGALSDYPADAKLKALGVSGLFDVVLSAQDPEVSSLKPNPRGLLTAIARLGAASSEALYVGDRVDVDAATAQAAGVRCAILTRRARLPGAAYTTVSGYPELQRRLSRSIA